MQKRKIKQEEHEPPDFGEEQTSNQSFNSPEVDFGEGLETSLSEEEPRDVLKRLI